MYGTPITVIGNVVDDVKLSTTMSGLSRVSFRVVNTERRRDRETNEWVDGRKLFVVVTFWREVAENVAVSVKKGDPVVVTGRIYTRQYIKDENNRVSYEIEPDTIGHDLSRGVCVFSKRKRGYSGSVEVDNDGLPVRPDDDAVDGGYVLMSDGSPVAVRSTASASRVPDGTASAAGNVSESAVDDVDMVPF